jgi:hypothetical protein
MLAHLLALAIALGSFILYFSAFFFPEIHRKSDFYWSGLGLFYGLVLWVCAGRITGAVLLGTLASTALLLWFGTQTLILRRALASPAEKTKVSQTMATRLQALSPQRLWEKIRGKPTTPEPTVNSQPEATQTTEATGQAETTTPEETENTLPTDKEESSEASSETEEKNPPS